MLFDTYQSDNVTNLSLTILEGHLKAHKGRNGILQLAIRISKFLVVFVFVVYVEGYLQFFRRLLRDPKLNSKFQSAFKEERKMWNQKLYSGQWAKLGERMELFIASWDNYDPKI